MDKNLAWLLGYLLSDGSIATLKYRKKGDETHLSFICKYSDRDILEKVKIAAIINNSDSILATNWNNGASQRVQHLKIYISKAMGSMIYVDSIGFDFETKQDLNLRWSGWLDSSKLTQISAL